MAKTGFSFYRADTDRFQDLRIKKLRKYFKSNGFCVFEFVVNEIYKTNNCFIVKDETLIFNIAEYWDIKEDLIDHIIIFCCNVGLFDKNLFNQYGILTSFDIQTQWLKQTMTVDFNIIPIEYLLIDRSSIPFYKTTKNPRLVERNSKLWKKISKDILKRDNYTCAYCGKRGGILEIDHILPISRGGSDNKSNLVTSCRHCNRQKKDKTVEEFIKWRIKHGYSNNGT